MKDLTGWRLALHLLDRYAERFLLYGFYIFLTLIIVLEVFRRFALDSASLWGEETARFSFIYLTWIGASWGVRKRQHIRINIIHRYLSNRGVGIMYIISDIAMLIFAYFSVSWFVPVLQTTAEQGAVTQALRVNQEYFMFAVLLGFILLTIRTIQMLVWDVHAVINDHPVYEGESIFGRGDD
ncbi:TRAP transporter small permease [Halalkalicoccus sp. NIPERK01]|uniref:TRAP transporter small permease n=1 Tax=Halalkalicoccus sp. NIPERK01 TaxID=3053469 RepID=UPI00256F5ED0|nr:TRAP transporter small permease [Halalkalicoccus sp. NIPERK01]MDL5363845.1 TRAP transporter small permease [Halalkalicoccus sp. NIPERK01]